MSRTLTSTARLHPRTTAVLALAVLVAAAPVPATVAAAVVMIAAVAALTAAWRHA
jgi:hypothetical protein